ncbi:MAG: hypothetical protein NTV32_03220 [Gammaproteobacteria bacterium]|nr:hypothetical protein [Gammaproteobacteria bacterium]
MNNLKTIAISTIAGGLFATAGAGLARAYKADSDLDLLYAGLFGMSAGLILSASGILIRKIYQACASEEISIAASSSDAESSDGDEHARYYLKNLLDSWKSQDADEESLLSDSYPTTLFYGAALAAHTQHTTHSFTKE